MPTPPSSRRLAAYAFLLLGTACLLWLLGSSQRAGRLDPPSVSAASTAAPASDDHALLATAAQGARAQLVATLRDRLNRPGVRADEALLAFKNIDAYRRFLDRARGLGWNVETLDGLLTIRLRVKDYAGLADELGAHAADYAAVGANPIVSALPPPPEDREARVAQPVGDRLLAALGLSLETDTSAWGRGVLIAILDGGASADATLGTRLKYLDIGYGVTGGGEDGLHGTAVASLAAGASADARGVAPGADLLSVRVTGADGASDAFSLAKGIMAALSAGAQVINISLGGYSSSPVLAEAIEQAVAAGVAVVASSGNDQAAQLVWPAAYPGVVSVGATDAAGVQALFSNSGEGLQLTAPGYAVQAAGLAGTRVSFTGTSASAPVVSGSIAALLSQNSTLTPVEAADVLATYANDGGSAGPDSDYGRGTVNLGWAIDRSNPDRVDPAVSSLGFDRAAGVVSAVIQNRGARSVTGLTLRLDVGDTGSTHSLATLAAGASVTVSHTVSRTKLFSGTTFVVRARLLLPEGLADQNTTNNQRAIGVTIP